MGERADEGFEVRLERVLELVDVLVPELVGEHVRYPLRRKKHSWRRLVRRATAGGRRRRFASTRVMFDSEGAAGGGAGAPRAERAPRTDGEAARPNRNAIARHVDDTSSRIERRDDTRRTRRGSVSKGGGHGRVRATSRSSSYKCICVLSWGTERRHVPLWGATCPAASCTGARARR